MKDNLSERVTRPWVPFREFIGNNPYLGFFRTNNLTVIVSRRPVWTPQLAGWPESPISV